MLDDIRNQLSRWSRFGQLAFLSLLTLCSFSIFSFIGLSLTSLLFDIELLEMGEIVASLEDYPQHIPAVKLLQFISTLGIFCVPALLFPWLINLDPGKFLRLNTPITGILLILTPIIVLLGASSVSVLVEFNSQIDFPDFMQGAEDWMKEKETQAAELTHHLLIMNHWVDLLINLCLVAALPAIGEELMFRGVLQRFFGDSINNMHLGILFSAILFSAIHMQFYGFLPRLALGLLFGYLFYWSGNLWIPIWAHFIHNGFQIVLSYLFQIGIIDTNIEEVNSIPWMATLLTTVGLVVFLRIFYGKSMEMSLKSG